MCMRLKLRPTWRIETCHTENVLNASKTGGDFEKSVAASLKAITKENVLLKAKLRLVEKRGGVLEINLTKAMRKIFLFPLNVNATSYSPSLSPRFSALLPFILTSYCVLKIRMTRSFALLLLINRGSSSHRPS